MTLIVRPFQKEGVRVIERAGGGLIADDVGLGKTLQALMILKRNPDWLPALVICPATVKWGWEHEALDKVKMRASIAEGYDPPADGSLIDEPLPDLTIINYDILQQPKRKDPHKRHIKKQSWTAYLIKKGIKTVVIDEAQFVSNPKSARTKSTKKICKHAQHVIALSATPFKNKPKELFPILNMIWPHKFRSEWRYKHTYCDPKMTPWGWNFDGACNLDQLNLRLKKLGMVRRLKRDVMKELPKLECNMVLCELSDYDEYNRAVNDFIQYVHGHDPHLLNSAIKGGGLFMVGYIMRLIARLKMRAVVDWTRMFLDGSDEKIALFLRHRAASAVLQKKIPGSIVVDGTVTGRDRQNAIRQFQTDPNVRALIGSIAACGTGLNGMQYACNHLAFVELGHTPADHTQVEGRLDRMGQPYPVTSHYLISKGTWEARMCKMLEKKQTYSEQVMDGKVKGQATELNLFTELARQLEREKNNGKP